MPVFFSVLGSLLAASGTVPYLVATVHGQTKPRILTWSTWCVLTAVAAAAALSNQKFGAGIFAGLGALSTGAVAITGLRFGDRSLQAIDVACLVGVVVGLALWCVSGKPAFGVWAAIAVDFVGLVPTLQHAWRSPNEETATTYALVGVGGLMTVSPVAMSGSMSLVAIGYPLYAAVSLGATAVLIALRREHPPLDALFVRTEAQRRRPDRVRDGRR